MNSGWQFLRRVTAVTLVYALFVAAFGFAFIPAQAQKESGKQRLFDKFNRADAVTRAVRDKSNELINVKIDSMADREKASQLGTLVEDYGSFVVLAKNKTLKSAESNLAAQKLDTTINLPNGKFDPISETRPETVGFENKAALLPAGKNYYIVQTAVPSSEA